MTCGDGMAEGLGRVLAVRTKQEASGVTVAIPQPEHVPVEKEFDPTISDVWRAEDLGVQESENVPREAAHDTASRVLPVVKTRQLAVCCGGSVQEHRAPMPQQSCGTGQAPEATPALKARPVSTIKGSDSMKWRTFVLMLFSVAIGCLYGVNSRTSEKVDVLMAYYMEQEYGPAALQGKTCLEVTPQMENIGADRFIAIARQLPYTDAATLERLFNEEGRWVVAEMWGEGANTVVRLDNYENNSPFGIFGKRWAGNNHYERSVLIHPHPTSLGVYKYRIENSWDRLTASSFNERKHYDVTSEGASRVADYVATGTPIAHEELAKLGDMNLMGDYGNGVLFLVNQFGTGERFIRLADDDYRSLRNGMYFSSYSAEELRCESSSWWREMERSIIKEEQTAVK